MLIVSTPHRDDPRPNRFLKPLWHDDHPQALELQRRLPHDHLARRIEQAVGRLDLRPWYACYHGTGDRPFPPALLLMAVLFEVQQGRPRPAQWFKAAHEADPVRWLLKGCTPSRTSWYSCRDRLGPILYQLHDQVMALALGEGLTPARRAAQDGTLVAANASRHRLVNAKTLDQRQQQPAPAVRDDQANRTGAALPAWLATTPSGCQRQQQRLERARQRLNDLQAYHRGKRASKRKDAEKSVVSLSDPEAAVGRDKEKVYRPLYKVQVVDDLDSPFVLGYAVLAQQNDAGVLKPLLAQVQQSLGQPLQVLLADGSYTGGVDLAAAGVTLYAPLPTAQVAPRQIPKEEFVWRSADGAYECPQGHRLELETVSRQQRSTPEVVELRHYRCAAAHCQQCPLRARCTPSTGDCAW